MNVLESYPPHRSGWIEFLSLNLGCFPSNSTVACKRGWMKLLGWCKGGTWVEICTEKPEQPFKKAFPGQRLLEFPTNHNWESPICWDYEFPIKESLWDVARSLLIRFQGFLENDKGLEQTKVSSKVRNGQRFRQPRGLMKDKGGINILNLANIHKTKCQKIPIISNSKNSLQSPKRCCRCVLQQSLWC